MAKFRYIFLLNFGVDPFKNVTFSGKWSTLKDVNVKNQVQMHLIFDVNVFKRTKMYLIFDVKAFPSTPFSRERHKL